MLPTWCTLSPFFLVNSRSPVLFITTISEEKAILQASHLFTFLGQFAWSLLSTKVNDWLGSWSGSSISGSWALTSQSLVFINRTGGIVLLVLAANSSGSSFRLFLCLLPFFPAFRGLVKGTSFLLSSSKNRWIFRAFASGSRWFQLVDEIKCSSNPSAKRYFPSPRNTKIKIKFPFSIVNKISFP